MSDFALEKVVCIIGANQTLVDLFSKEYKVVSTDGVSPLDTSVDVFVTTKYSWAIFEFIKAHAKEGNVVIVTGNVPLGTTMDFFGSLRVQSLHVGYCPLTSLTKTQVISGITSEAAAEISEIYRRINPSIHIASSTDTAEMYNLAKLASQHVNTALENELLDICLTYRIPVQEVFNQTPMAYPPPDFDDLFLYHEIPLINKASKLTKKRPLRKALDFLAKYSHQRILVVASQLLEDQAFVAEVATVCPDTYTLHTSLSNEQISSEYLSANFDVIAVLDDHIALPEVSCTIVHI